jgi:hypothetical protein
LVDFGSFLAIFGRFEGPDFACLAILSPVKSSAITYRFLHVLCTLPIADFLVRFGLFGGQFWQILVDLGPIFGPSSADLALFPCVKSSAITYRFLHDLHTLQVRAF